MSLSILSHFRSSCRAGVFATLAVLTLSPAVRADNQVVLRIDPRTQAEADGIRLALTLYGIHRDIQSGGGISQQGLNNLAQLGQSGTGNLGLIEQRGNDHQGRLDQRGRNNAYGIFQSGRGTQAAVQQTGTGQAGLLFVHGW